MKSLKKPLNRYQRTSRQRTVAKPSPEDLIAVKAELANRIHELEALANPRAATTSYAPYGELNALVQERSEYVFAEQ